MKIVPVPSLRIPTVDGPATGALELQVGGGINRHGVEKSTGFQVDPKVKEHEPGAGERHLDSIADTEFGRALTQYGASNRIWSMTMDSSRLFTVVVCAAPAGNTSVLVVDRGVVG